MDRQRLGSTDLEVSRIGLGCSRLAGSFRYGGRSSDPASLVDHACDQGINLFDTADRYGQGESERVLGRALKSRRTEVVIATKAGYSLRNMGSLAVRLKPILRPLVRSVWKSNPIVERARSSQLTQTFSPSHLVRSVEGSLRRLKTDYLDVFQLHSPPRQVLEDGAFCEVLERMTEEGKIRYYGVSCASVEDALICLQYAGISTLQVEINLLQQDALVTLVASAADRGIGVIARQPFASGFLAKSASELQVDHMDPSKIERKRYRADQFRFLEIPGHRTLAQASLRFLLQARGISVAIPGMSSIAHVNSAMSALRAPALTEDEFRCVRAMGSIPHPGADAVADNHAANAGRLSH